MDYWSHKEYMNIVVVGSTGIGKTCLTMKMVNAPMNGPVPTLSKYYTINLTNEFTGKDLMVMVRDTAGHDAFSSLRAISYRMADIFLLCFSVDSRSSFDDAWVKFFTEIRDAVPYTTIILVGTKCDLRLSKEATNCIPFTECLEMAKKMGACAYGECSIFQKASVRKILRQAIKVVTTPEPIRSTPPDSPNIAKPLATSSALFLNLPVHLIHLIAANLSPVELKILSKVDRECYNIANDPILWQLLCRKIDPLFKIQQTNEHPKTVHEYLTHMWVNKDIKEAPLKN